MKESVITPESSIFESIACYLCGETSSRHLTYAEDDLTGKEGRFQFVVCDSCGLAYQNPRVKLEHIKGFYDEEYIAHRKKTDWGILTPFYNHAMGKLDRDKIKLTNRYISLDQSSRILDIGCGAATYIQQLKERYGCSAAGVDFKDLSHLPGYDSIDFYNGLFCDQNFNENEFDLISLWHFLEHDYDPVQTLEYAGKIVNERGIIIVEVPRLDSLSYKVFGDRWPGLQAPQHTVLYDRRKFIEIVEKAGLEVVDYLPYGAFPAYFYLFAGLAFKILKGKGLDLSKAILPYFIGNLLLSPMLLFEKHLNLSMQTIICRRGS